MSRLRQAPPEPRSWTLTGRMARSAWLFVNTFAVAKHLWRHRPAVAGSLLLNVRMFSGKARCMSEDAPELTAELVVDGAVPSQPVVSLDGCWVARALGGRC
jgi:hypothetical protein